MKQNETYLLHNSHLMQGDGNFLTGVLSDVFKGEGEEPNFVVKVEIDTQSLMKIAGLGLGLLVANKLINKY